MEAKSKRFTLVVGLMDIFDGKLMKHLARTREFEDPSAKDLLLEQVGTEPVVLVELSDYQHMKSFTSLNGDANITGEPLISAIVDAGSFEGTMKSMLEIAPTLIQGNQCDATALFRKDKRITLRSLPCASAVLFTLALYTRKNNISIETLDMRFNGTINFNAFRNVKIFFPGIKKIIFSKDNPIKEDLMWIFDGITVETDTQGPPAARSSPNHEEVESKMVFETPAVVEKPKKVIETPTKPVFSRPAKDRSETIGRTMSLDDFPAVTIDLSECPVNVFIFELINKQWENVKDAAQMYQDPGCLTEFGSYYVNGFHNKVMGYSCEVVGDGRYLCQLSGVAEAPDGTFDLYERLISVIFTERGFCVEGDRIDIKEKLNKIQERTKTRFFAQSV